MRNVKETIPQVGPAQPVRSDVALSNALVSLRPEASEDAAFLFALYASTREEELNATGWDAATRRAFIKMQFRCQHEGYHRAFPTADYSIVSCEGRSIGRIVIHRTVEEVRVVDLALLPAYRGQGIGTRLMKEILREAAQSQKPVRLQVLKSSRQVRWYERLGFSHLGESGFHDEKEWRPGAV